MKPILALVLLQLSLLVLCYSFQLTDVEQNLTSTPKEETLVSNYGRYCGRGHYSEVGDIPIDIFDRVCQIHDICVTARGMMDCYCNEQLYWLISYLKATTPEQQTAKDFILKGIYASVLFCTNWDSFDVNYYIGSTKERGFNYLPLYWTAETSQGYHTFCSNSTDIILIAMASIDYYHNATKMAFVDPKSLGQFNHMTIGAKCLTIPFDPQLEPTIYVIIGNLGDTTAHLQYYFMDQSKNHFYPRLVR